MEENIKELIIAEGADVCGIGSIDRFIDAPPGFAPSDIWAGCKSVIAIGIALPKGLYEVPSRLIYGHFNADICNVLDKIDLKCAKQLEQIFSCVAIPIPCDAPYEYWDEETKTGKGLLSMKHIAVGCGLGTLGMNTLLINPKYGNRLTLGAILTDLELEADELCKEQCIPGCNMCIKSCPVGAISPDGVNQLLCRTNTYGKTARGYDTVDCNLCRAKCPKRLGT